MAHFRLLTVCLLLACGEVAGAQPAYDVSAIRRERLDRGLVAYADETGDSICISWRSLREDPADARFAILLNGVRQTSYEPTKATFAKLPSSLFLQQDWNRIDLQMMPASASAGTAGAPSAAAIARTRVQRAALQPYLTLPLMKPEGGQTPDGEPYSYVANDASVGDVDGDGQYEIFLKWEPSNARDNSHEGYTGPVLLDCYRLSGERLWRIDLGPNIRAGAHYTQFLVYDFDGDGRAELMAKTADGSRDGKGGVIGDARADYRYSGVINHQIGGKGSSRQSQVRGRILSGPEYLTVFEGTSGRALATVDYIPERGNPMLWGDSYGNRCDRFLACVAYLDGKHASAVFCRGYYTRSVLAAWDFDGKRLTSRWVFDTQSSDTLRSYAGQGNHNLRVADFDADGCDEIIYGAMVVDNDGRGRYTTRLGHGDALHLMPFFPDDPRLQVWSVHENKRDGSVLRDAATGRILFQLPSQSDVGRGMAADVDPRYPGVEMWSSASGGLLTNRGERIAQARGLPVNFAVWWDGDLLREMLDRARVSKYDWRTERCNVLLDFSSECAFNNGTKSNPCLSADILGDWREEIVVRTHDSSALRIYLTPLPTTHRITCLMQDIPYRLSVATENVGYNQPPETGFYLGETTVWE